MSQARAETGDKRHGRAAPDDAGDERVTLRVAEDLLDDVEQLVEDGHYDNRSEVFRTGARQLTGGDPS